MPDVSAKLFTPSPPPLTRGNATRRPLEELRKIFLSTRTFRVRFVTTGNHEFLLTWP
jgi:hypothetical protein